MHGFSNFSLHHGMDHTVHHIVLTAKSGWMHTQEGTRTVLQDWLSRNLASMGTAVPEASG